MSAPGYFTSPWPGAQRWTDAGHFLQEDKGRELTEKLMVFIKATPVTQSRA